MLNVHTLYTLHYNADAPAFLTTDRANLGEVVLSLIGRNALSYPSVADKLRRTGRVYLAGTKRNSGVVVRRQCGFCQNALPIGNAAAWTDADAPRSAPCPRCGSTFPVQA